MAYDEALADRMRAHLEGVAGIEEKKMFGGLSFMLNGNLACGVIGDELCLRVGPVAYEDALGEPGVRLFDFSGRPMKGWVMVGGPGISDDEALGGWIQRGLDFAGSLPPK